MPFGFAACSVTFARPASLPEKRHQTKRNWQKKETGLPANCPSLRCCMRVPSCSHTDQEHQRFAPRCARNMHLEHGYIEVSLHSGGEPRSILYVDVTDDRNLTSSCHQIPTSDFGGKRAEGLPKPQVLSYHTAHCVIKVTRWQMGMASELRRGTWTPPCFLAKIEGSHVDGDGRCSHLLRAQVLGSAL